MVIRDAGMHVDLGDLVSIEMKDGLIREGSIWSKEGALG